MRKCLSVVVISLLTSAAAAQTTRPATPTDGMAWIPQGEFRMGSEDARFPDAQPVHPVWVDGFWMDKNDVTNEQFAAFVKETHYVTVAERKPNSKDFPGVPAESLVAGSCCFQAPGAPVTLDNALQWWGYVKGADWKHPEGPGSNIKGHEQYPVVQIAYEDAQAYAKWAGKRLPTEAEWERAARGGLDQKAYVWGDEFRPAGKFMANTYQGHFPNQNTADDGFAGLAPVASFPANGYGLYDMAGNVWQWTSDWYSPASFAADAAGGLAVNPQGPAEKESNDPQEPGVAKHVQKGGSFLCTDQYCSRYMPGGRGKCEPSTSTNHVGFRCVISPAK